MSVARGLKATHFVTRLAASAVSVALLVGACTVEETHKSNNDREVGGEGGDGTAGSGGSKAGGSNVSVGGQGGDATSAGRGGDENQAGAGGVAGGAGGARDGETIVDPAPDATEPGETKACDDAPDTDLTLFEYTDIEETTHTFSGNVADAVGPGTYYVVARNQAIRGPIPTEDNGTFDVTLPLFCGEQTVKLVWNNDSCAVATVTRVVRVDCATEDIRLTLSWDDRGQDFELHLVKQGGRINDNATDCTWTSCIGTGPDWGEAGVSTDDPVKDVDNTGFFGPENIYYSDPEPGTYTLMVEHWGSGADDADGQLIVNAAGRTTTLNVESLPSHWVWTAGTLEWPSGKVTRVDERFDCNGEWSGGCTAELP